MKKIFISGITGKVGKLLSKDLLDDEEFSLVGGSCSVANKNLNKDIGEFLGKKNIGANIYDSLPRSLEIEVVIDFSTPSSAIELLDIARSKGIPVLIGTTGFNESQLEFIACMSKDIPILLAPNTSQGVAILKNIIQKSSSLFSEGNSFQIRDTHHEEKKDSPSGTALELKKEILNQVPDAKISIESLREGSNPGEHTITIGLENELIEITHKAENRSIFAQGAITGARWLIGKPSGLYSMADIYTS